MDPVELHVTISRPREAVFAYLEDVTHHAEFLDHFMVDWHLTREDPRGLGAGARFRFLAPLQRFPWGDLTFIEVERPRRIVAAGRTGKYTRVRTRAVWELDPAGEEATRVSLTVASVPKLRTDRLAELLAGRGWARRRFGRGLRRLRSILEEDEARGRRPTLSGGPRKPASEFHFDPDRFQPNP